MKCQTDAVVVKNVNFVATSHSQAMEGKEPNKSKNKSDQNYHSEIIHISFQINLQYQLHFGAGRAENPINGVFDGLVMNLTHCSTLLMQEAK